MLNKIIILAIIFYLTNEIQCNDTELEEISIDNFLDTEEEIQEIKKHHHHHDHKFDFLLFAQVWPISGCIKWEERDEHNSCSLPNRKQWTTHGLWPTKNFTIGPLYCNRSVHFNFDTLKPILNDLELHWTNVRANTELDNFWKHEWEKHGTCAMVLEPVNNEYNYFHKGLELNQKYPLSQYLKEANITPGGLYTTEEVLEAVKNKIQGKNPALECEKMHEFKEPVLTQISICLDKNFEVIGCESTHGGVYGRCPHNGKIEYPATEKLTLEENHAKSDVEPTPVGPTEKGINKGMIFGISAGCAIFLAILTYFIKTRCDTYQRNRQYDAL